MRMTMQRSNEEYILISLSLGGAIAVTPFAIFRLWHGEWVIGLIDALIVILMSAVGSVVYFRRSIKFCNLVVSIAALLAVTIAIYLKGPTLIYWAYPTMVGVFFILAPRRAIFLTLLAAAAISATLIYKMEMMIFVVMMMSLVVNNLFAYIFASRMHYQKDQLSLLVRRDPLTATGNRRALSEKMDELIASYQRSKQVTSLIVLDVDYFKKINDKFGHAMGDQVLIKLTELINSRIRATDSLYRIGGEEFVILAVGANLQAALGIAEELRTLMECNTLVEDHVVTISLGVAEINDGESADNWLARGDKALYRAKEAGRNRTSAAQ